MRLFIRSLLRSLTLLLVLGVLLASAGMYFEKKTELKDLPATLTHGRDHDDDYDYDKDNDDTDTGSGTTKKPGGKYGTHDTTDTTHTKDTTDTTDDKKKYKKKKYGHW